MKFQSKFIVSALCSSLVLVGCGGGDSLDRATKVRDVVASTVVVPSDSPAHDMPDAAKATTTSAKIESVEDIRAAAAAVQKARPGFYDTVMSMEPRRTRNDMLRFIGGEMHDPDAAPIFALRLLDGVNTPELERRALPDAIARTMGDFGTYLAVLAPQELDTEVRAGLVHELARATPEAARKGIEFGLADPDAVVRESAMRSLASQSELQGERLSESIVTALDDQDDSVREAAAFAARVRGERLALDRLVAVAQSDTSDARIQALRAIEKIDASYLAQIDLAALANDEDQRVARFASRTINSQ